MHIGIQSGVFASALQNAYLEDGYTETGFLAGLPRLHPAVNFEYRPMLVTELAQYSARTAHCSEEAVRREVARWLSIKILEWDVTDVRGQVVPIQSSSADPLENILRLRPAVFTRLWKIVSGDSPSDPPFDKAIDLEADAKNWPAGCGCGGCIPKSPDAIATTACDMSTTMPPASD
jgi:hypothetical protein